MTDSSRPDIVEKLGRFPISEWKEARDEIIRLRDLVALGNPLSSDPTKEVETATYLDGTTATGTASLPDTSPLEQNLIDLKKRVDDLTVSLFSERNNTEKKAQRIAELEASIDLLKLEAQNAQVLPVEPSAPLDLETSPLVVSLREQVSNLRADMVGKATEVIETKAALKESQSELELTKSLVTAASRSQSESLKQVAAYKEEVDSLTSKITDLTSEVSGLTRQLTDANLKIADLSVVKPVSTVTRLKNIFLTQK